MTQIPGRWRKPSRSGQGQSNNCVEARLAETPQLSDSRHDGVRPVLPVTTTDYLALLNTVKTDPTA
ncbi:uncharacterized protein DUF397 [Stackebrandtia albiflava]|uniref:Uncharacterized protein DUF397 n=1 Tax=Stackebrandtia albiflava TaxID=406432 RepID=A0A562V9L2_9ACTN|nr:DUF397 domain-containing protein [Stackebrandtia albiflava]TWJ14542.1 uncharacterized protein DUF397 [Stackebrandtia albiflava]